MNIISERHLAWLQVQEAEAEEARGVDLKSKGEAWKAQFVRAMNNLAAREIQHQKVSSLNAACPISSHRSAPQSAMLHMNSSASCCAGAESFVPRALVVRRRVPVEGKALARLRRTGQWLRAQRSAPRGGLQSCGASREARRATGTDLSRAA